MDIPIKIQEDLYAKAEKVAADKTPRRLSDEETFAAAFVAGVPFTTEYTYGKLTLTTVERCAAVHTGEEVIVYRSKGLCPPF